MMADTFEFTLDEESEKRLYDILTDVNTETTPSFTITDKYGHTADYVKAVHGRWIIRDNPGTGWYRITCSECGEDVTATAPCIGCVPNAKVNWNYCPECGARMDAERKDNG